MMSHLRGRSSSESPPFVSRLLRHLVPISQHRILELEGTSWSPANYNAPAAGNPRPLDPPSNAPRPANPARGGRDRAPYDSELTEYAAFRAIMG